jgi:adenylate kinase family enzyme
LAGSRRNTWTAATSFPTRSSSARSPSGSTPTRRPRASIENRLEQYHAKTEPLIGFYAQRDLLHRIDGCASPDEVAAELRDTLATLKLEANGAI